MKKFLISGLLFTSISHANVETNCQLFKIVETSSIKATLLNTSHDELGESDEIRMELFSSSKKLNEKKFFSDFSGIVTHNQGPIQKLVSIDKSVRFNQEKVLADIEINYSSIYNRYLNIVMVDQDLSVPVASGSIEMPFVVATGGNHDDLIFSKSLELTQTKQSKDSFIIHNNIGDVLEIVITPVQTRNLGKNKLLSEYQSLLNEITLKSGQLKTQKMDLISHMRLQKMNDEQLQKAAYFKDILEGKVEDSCVR